MNFPKFPHSAMFVGVTAYSKTELTFLEFHFETEAKVDFPSACILTKASKI